MVFSQDVVNVLHNLIKYWVRNDNRFYYICGNQSVRLVDFINHINKKYYNKNIKFNFNQKDAIFPKNDFILSNKYTCRDLDVSFTDLYKGVDDYLQVT